MVWRRDDPQGDEAAKIAPLIVPYTRGFGVDVGCGAFKPYPHFIGIDSGKQYGRPVTDITHDGEALPFADGVLDFVFSSHFLEHVVDYKACLADWWRALKVGGHLVVYLPHKDLYPNIGQDGANPDHKHDYLPEDILQAMNEIAMESDHGYLCHEDETRSQGREYSFYQVYEKREAGVVSVYRPWRPRRRNERPRCLVIRYGGVGDMMMVSALLPALKAKGFNITMNTTPDGERILKHDPTIDAWMIQDRDQVPNERLHVQHHAIGQRFDHVVNLCEVVEGSVLTIPGRVDYLHPDATRRRLFGHINYIGRHFDVAGIDLPYPPPGPKFHRSKEEKAWAHEQCRQARIENGWTPPQAPQPIVVWALSGSSIHKAYPYTDAVIARLMMETKAIVLLVGDDLSQMLELGWENERRVIMTCGVWSIRKALSIALEADVVVGPETGILNAVSHEAMRKVVMLSHSSRENLTRDWVNTITIAPDVPCYPCHRMHHGRQFCPTDEKTGGAACASSIDPEGVFGDIGLAG